MHPFYGTNKLRTLNLLHFVVTQLGFTSAEGRKNTARTARFGAGARADFTWLRPPCDERSFVRPARRTMGRP